MLIFIVIHFLSLYIYGLKRKMFQVLGLSDEYLLVEEITD